MKQKKFYINLQTNEIKDYSDPRNFEFEIVANEKEVIQIRKLFNNLEREEKQALSHIINFLDEQEVDKEREKYSENLKKIYNYIYKYGTKETKEKIKTLI